MYILESYSLAVVLLVITMLCWGSWPNMFKLTKDNWRFELFYWDYVIGIVLLSLIFGFTLGSSGESGRSFLADLSQADSKFIISALIGGAIFNLANILFMAAIALAGMSVAFPVGGGIISDHPWEIHYIYSQELVLSWLLSFCQLLLLSGFQSNFKKFLTKVFCSP